MVTRMAHQFYRLAWSVVLVLGLFGAADSDAQPLRDRVLQDVEISGQCIVVGFSYPVQYVRHFPPRSGGEIQIRFRPSALGWINSDALFGRETVHLPSRGRVHLSEVSYEGDSVGGPYLVVDFDRKVNFRVGTGGDFRSIVITVGEAPGDTPCIPQ